MPLNHIDVQSHVLEQVKTDSTKRNKNTFGAKLAGPGTWTKEQGKSSMATAQGGLPSQLNMSLLHAA